MFATMFSTDTTVMKLARKDVAKATCLFIALTAIAVVIQSGETFFESRYSGNEPERAISVESKSRGISTTMGKWRDFPFSGECPEIDKIENNLSIVNQKVGCSV